MARWTMISMIIGPETDKTVGFNTGYIPYKLLKIIKNTIKYNQYTHLLKHSLNYFELIVFL